MSKVIEVLNFVDEIAQITDDVVDWLYREVNPNLLLSNLPKDRRNELKEYAEAVRYLSDSILKKLA